MIEDVTILGSRIQVCMTRIARDRFPLLVLLLVLIPLLFRPVLSSIDPIGCYSWVRRVCRVEFPAGTAMSPKARKIFTTKDTKSSKEWSTASAGLQRPTSSEWRL